VKSRTKPICQSLTGGELAARRRLTEFLRICF
jgi:hypothetical protein